MHEMRVAREICRIAERHAAPGELHRVVTVGLEVGDDAGVEVGSLTFCLEVLLAQPPFGSAKPELVRCGGDALRVTHLEVDDGRPDD